MTTLPGMTSSASSISFRIESGVYSASFGTTQLPGARAGASFHEAMESEKFHGMICPMTPYGSRIMCPVRFSSVSDAPLSKRTTPAKYQNWSATVSMSVRASTVGSRCRESPDSQVLRHGIQRVRRVRSTACRSKPVVVRHSRLYAPYATSTTLSPSSAPTAETRVNRSPITGSVVSMSSPWPDTHSPPMYKSVCAGRTSLAVF